jgi:hypothetical protein
MGGTEAGCAGEVLLDPLGEAAWDGIAWIFRSLALDLFVSAAAVVASVVVSR